MDGGDDTWRGRGPLIIWLALTVNGSWNKTEKFVTAQRIWAAKKKQNFHFVGDKLKSSGRMDDQLQRWAPKLCMSKQQLKKNGRHTWQEPWNLFQLSKLVFCKPHNKKHECQPAKCNKLTIIQLNKQEWHHLFYLVIFSYHRLLIVWKSIYLNQN